MVALAMAAPLLDKLDVTADSIYKKSIDNKYSRQGEMFSGEPLVYN